ncbi:prefoldin subunit 2 [Ixodes scapularis]
MGCWYWGGWQSDSQKSRLRGGGLGGLVAEALQKVDGDRRCYRMVGGVLVERTVKDILPAVMQNKDNIAKSVDALNDRIVKKGQEVNEYREKHNIQIRVSSNAASKPQSSDKSAAQPATGVLV